MNSSSGTSNNNPSPGKGPGDINKAGYYEDKSKGKKKRKVLPEHDAFTKNYDDFVEANLKTLKYKEGTDLNYKDGTNLKYNLPDINDKYRDYLPSGDKQKLNNLSNKRYKRIEFNDSTTVKEFLNSKKNLHTEMKNTSIQIRNI